MPRMLINCPNCRQPITAEIDQLFDAGANPEAKQKLLSGAFNQIQCSVCGYRGMFPSIIVYHDPVKELLMTYTPPELALQRNDQERTIGSLINQVINNLPLEKRKGYLFSPQPAFTLQGMVEKILEADGITKEMLQAQQQRLSLIQRLLTISTEESRVETIRQEDALIDASFLAIFRRLMEAAAMSGDQAALQELEQIQAVILRETTFGRELQEQAKDVEAALKDLQAAGQKLTREKLIDLAVKAPNDNYLRALVNFARTGMDYQFFQILSEKIDRARGDGRARLVELRGKLLDWTREMDQQLEAHIADVRKLVAVILQAEDISEAMAQSLPYVDEFFLRVLDEEMKAAEQAQDLDKMAKFQKIVEVLQQASQSAPEIALVEELLDVPEDEHQAENWRSILTANAAEVTPEFLNALGSIIAQIQESGATEDAQRIRELNRVALRFSMEQNLKAPS